VCVPFSDLSKGSTTPSYTQRGRLETYSPFSHGVLPRSGRLRNYYVTPCAGRWLFGLVRFECRLSDPAALRKPLKSILAALSLIIFRQDVLSEVFCESALFPG